MNRQELLKCIKEAEENPYDYSKDGLTGFSGKKIVSLLRNFAGKMVNTNDTYLEIGVYRGLTLLSVATGVPEFEVFGIDNFAFFDKEGKNMAIFQERKKSLNAGNARIINCDYEDALEHLPDFTGNKKAVLCFVDGPHDYRSQILSLLLIKPHLADNAVIVVDDCNYRHVRQANRDFLITNPQFRLIFQKYTEAHPGNLNGSKRREAEDGWWNGINILMKDDDNLFSPFYPPTIRKRTLFENDHHIHTSKFPEAHRKYSALINMLAKLRHNHFSKDFTGNYASLNTFSNIIKEPDLNPSFSDKYKDPEPLIN